MSECCSITGSQEGSEWPEGVISVKITMNPYLLALAWAESEKRGIRPWELINTALWEKLGKPDSRTLMEFAANLEIDELDPKWLKRLKITAQHEQAIFEIKAERAALTAKIGESPDNGDGDV
jgi:hypothetical protein